MTREAAISRRRHHQEKHLVNRIGWLRAAVLGANAFWGALALGITAGIGKRFGTII